MIKHHPNLESRAECSCLVRINARTADGMMTFQTLNLFRCVFLNVVVLRASGEAAIGRQCAVLQKSSV